MLHEIWMCSYLLMKNVTRNIHTRYYLHLVQVYRYIFFKHILEILRNKKPFWIHFSHLSKNAVKLIINSVCRSRLHSPLSSFSHISNQYIICQGSELDIPFLKRILNFYGTSRPKNQLIIANKLGFLILGQIWDH